MNQHLPRRTRARPRLDYAEHTLQVAREKGQRRQHYRRSRCSHGMLFLRCGGGFRVLRRDWLPGEERS